MDTKDKDTNIDLSSSGVMFPDTSVSPEEIVTLTRPAGDKETVESAPALADQGTKSPQQKSPTPLQDSLRRLWRDKRAMASVGVILFFVLLAIIGPPIYQHIGGIYNSPTNGAISPGKYHNPYWQELSNQDQFISGMYWLGTDSLGRDMLARLMQGVLISLTVALLVEIVDIVLGVMVGVLAGYYGGWIDQILARVTDIVFAFPGLLFVILLTGIFGTQADVVFSHIPVIGANGNARLILVSIALAFVAWPLMARFVRGQTLQLKEQQFVEAARTSGTTNTQIILRHIVPNLLSIVIVASTLDISNTIIAEAGISLLGLGVQPPGSSIGLMIVNGQAMIDSNPWEVLLPSIVLAIIVLAFSFLGDGLNDAFNPRSKD
jgi:peptide/nickel transport system permease protein